MPHAERNCAPAALESVPHWDRNPHVSFILPGMLTVAVPVAMRLRERDQNTAESINPKAQQLPATSGNGP